MFSITEIILIGIAVAIDCLTVCIAAGIAHKRFDGNFALAIALSFGIFQALMPALGWQITILIGDFIKNIDHWVAFGLLSFIGWKMITNSDENENSSYIKKNILLILSLSIATSIDALAIGVTFTCVGYKAIEEILMPISVIGLISFLFSMIGYSIGSYIGEKAKISIEKYGGILLICIGLKILVEHML
jgi:putative Mn2+ efflux pump MntP